MPRTPTGPRAVLRPRPPSQTQRGGHRVRASRAGRFAPRDSYTVTGPYWGASWSRRTCPDLEVRITRASTLVCAAASFGAPALQGGLVA